MSKLRLRVLYAPSIFDLFQNEYILFAVPYIELKDETWSIFEYVIWLIDHNGEWRVTYDSNKRWFIVVVERLRWLN